MTPERIGIDFRAVQRAVIIGIVALLVVNVGVWWLYGYFRERRESVDVRRTLVAPDPAPPTEPLLQVNPQIEWKEFQRLQMEQLNSYGWVSREDGIVRVPIDRAMELLIERGN